MTDIHFPAGSGRYLCVCPSGKQGALCEEDVDQCVLAPCSVGQCLNTAGGFRCDCPPGLRGEEDLLRFQGCSTHSITLTDVCVCQG